MGTNRASNVWGRVVVSRLFGFQKITIFSNGWIQFNGEPHEKLLAISGNAESVQSKTGLGRAAGALFTFGLNLLGPNLRGRMVLTILTDRDSHLLNLPAEPHFLGVLHELVAVGNSVIESASSAKDTSVTSEAKSTIEFDEGSMWHRSDSQKADAPNKSSQLKSLKESLAHGLISEREYLEQKAILLGKPLPTIEEVWTAQPNQESDSVVSQLVELKRLFDSGAISEQEFSDLKNRIINL